jgi:hypothetical protein
MLIKIKQEHNDHELTFAQNNNNNNNNKKKPNLYCILGIQKESTKFFFEEEHE